MVSMNAYSPCLNAPFGARCFLTDLAQTVTLIGFDGLNAPFGARCFLTRG